MRWYLRIALAAISTPFVVILYLNIEVLATRMGWDTLLAARFPQMSSFVTQPWVFALATLVVGFTLGLWVDFFLRKKEARDKAPSRPHEKKQGRETWQDALRKRIYITTQEGGCLIADAPPSERDEVADAYGDEIHDAIVRGAIRSEFKLPSSPFTVRLSGDQHEHELQQHRSEMLSEMRPVEKAEIARFYFQKGDLEAVKLLGHAPTEFEADASLSTRDKPA